MITLARNSLRILIIVALELAPHDHFSKEMLVYYNIFPLELGTSSSGRAARA